MDIFVKGVGGDPHVKEIKIAYEKIKQTYARPSKGSKLLKTGFSARGIDELMNGEALSNQVDRQLSAIIIGNALK